MWWVGLASLFASAYGQLTAQSSVAPELTECYTNASLNRNNLPPATVNVLIDIIQKLEDHPNVNMDLKQIAKSLLHTYRQDGIEYHPPEYNFGYFVERFPWAATFHAFHRHKLILTRLIPNSLQIFENDTLSSPLKCAIHNMLSITVDARDHGSCKEPSLQSLGTAGQVSDGEPTDPGSLGSESQLLGESLCPILGGVVKTSWGEVSAGNLIAGIAAGAMAQRVLVNDLSYGYVNHPITQQTVSSLYASTLSGDIAESVLVQGIERGPAISIGATGYWNSTQAPKYYMLRTRQNIETTDPEIRGDIDGFVLGSSLIQHLGIFKALKLSQLIDMYYSKNGVFNHDFRACNRRSLIDQYVSVDNLIPETHAFAAALDTRIPLRGAFTMSLIDLVKSAVTNFQNYAFSTMKDLSCASTDTLGLDYRLKTNLYLVIDSAWQYEVIYPAVSYLLDSIEVGKFGSSVTLLNAFDGHVVINTTWSLADFHSEYTLAKHQSMLNGVNLLSTFTNIRTYMQEKMEIEYQCNYVGGNSSVLLFLLNAGSLQNNDQVWNQARILKKTVPDLRILFATSTNQFDTLWNLVRDMHEDIHTISLTTTVNHIEAFGPTLDRIQQVGRRVINPLCGARYPNDVNSGNRTFDDFVEPGYVNFYSIHPNYFYRNNDERRIRISRTGADGGSLVVCHSRTVNQPRQNATILGLDENAITCQTIASTGNVEISLRNLCDGYSTISSCPLLYFSVQYTTTGVSTFSATCTDERACRFPYNLRYTVQIENFGCFNDSTGDGASLVEVTFAFFIDLLMSS